MYRATVRYSQDRAPWSPGGAVSLRRTRHAAAQPLQSSYRHDALIEKAGKKFAAAVQVHIFYVIKIGIMTVSGMLDARANGFERAHVQVPDSLAIRGKIAADEKWHRSLEHGFQ